MGLFVIADLHLSLNGEKPMDVFRGWQNYVQRLEEHWRDQVQQEDTVVIAGDISWAMRLEDALLDFQFLHSLPGQKILLKGNHDYWWSTRSKIDQFLAEHGFSDMRVLHNCAYQVEGKALCGTAGGSTIPKPQRTGRLWRERRDGSPCPWRRQNAWAGN